jgi:hypothetical protein
MPIGPNKTERIDEVLSSLDHVQRAKAPSFFYTRLLARMERENGAGPVVRLLARPALALSLAAIILVVNATAILEMWHDSSATATVAVSDSQQYASADYQMSSYPVYDDNTAEP